MVAKFTNRLVHEDSPYLQQHARNPVDWYPWGEEAFTKARAEDKPVFLSIGYSTCHWCHVMEVESFDDEEVAAYLNEHFVSIKLDREQRPDLDDIYMTGLQLIAGQGGWPMSNFLTPDGRPFFAGTYYPKQQFMGVLQRIVQVWNTQRDDVMKQAEEITGAIERYATARTDAVKIRQHLVRPAADESVARFDRQYGGFGSAPKFPNESILLVVFEDWYRHGGEQSKTVFSYTLDKMYQGGIYDQVAGGFHRYTVDRHWLVPHFEKMLYNQAQLVRVYLQGYRATGKDAWRRIARETVGYVLRDMRDDNGAFYSATDADSEGQEGRFFLWTPAEIDGVLAEDHAALVKDLYGVTEQGNFEGRNILHLKSSLEQYAYEHNLEFDEFIERLDRIRRTLYEARESRVHPLRDEKIITSWNAMMITAITLAGFELGSDEFVQCAAAAAEHIWDSHYTEDPHSADSRRKQQGLWRIGFRQQVSIPGNLEDYACLAEALLTLYEVTMDQAWLERGERLVFEMLELFFDAGNGGFFFSRASDQGPLILRPKSPMDGATPSGNSVALRAMVILSRLGEYPEVETRINECLSAFAGLLDASPSAFGYMVLAAESYLTGSLSRLQFAAHGKVKVVASRTGRKLVLDIAIAAGWHINAHEPGDAAFPATQVEGEMLAEVGYPPGTSRSLGFRHAPLNVYDGSVRIEARLAEDVERAGISLRLQACDDRRCLAPETLYFQLTGQSVQKHAP